MPLSVEWLNSNGFCKQIIEWHVSNGSPSPNETIDMLLASDLLEKHEWANSIILDLLSDGNKIKYVYFASNLLLDIFGETIPMVELSKTAIDTVKKCIGDPSHENKQAAIIAAKGATESADAAENIFSAGYHTACLVVYAAWGAGNCSSDSAVDNFERAMQEAFQATAPSGVEQEINDKIITYGRGLL